MLAHLAPYQLLLHEESDSTLLSNLKLNIEKCPYISIVPMCFENAYPQNIFSYFIFLSGCSSINVCYADMFLTVLPEAYRFHKQLPISFIIHFTFYLHKCRKKDLGETNA